MAAPRTIRTASGKKLPDPPDFDQNVFRAVEAEWLHYALGPNSEKLCARWVTVTMAGGKRHVQLQKDDGRGHSKRPNTNVDSSGYYMLHAVDGRPSMLILTVQDMVEAVYRHYLSRGPDEKTQEVFCRRFGNMYEGTRKEDIVWILNKIKIRTKEAQQGLLTPYTTSSSSNISRSANTTGAHAVQSPRKARVIVDLSSPMKTTATDRSLSASRKRLNTVSRDFSERESSRLRTEEGTWSNYIATQSVRHNPPGSTSTDDRASTANLTSVSTRTEDGKDSMSRLTPGTSIDPTFDIGKTTRIDGATRTTKKSESQESTDWSSLNNGRSAGQGNVITKTYDISRSVNTKTNGISSHDKIIKTDPESHAGGIRNLMSRSGKQTRTEVSKEFSAVEICQGSNKGGNTSMGGTAMRGTPTKVNKGFGGAARTFISPMTPVKPAGYPKTSAEVCNGYGPPKISLSHGTPTKKPATPMGPRADSARFPIYGPGGTPTHKSYASGTTPGLPFRAREAFMGNYEKKAVDSTAHLYKSAPEPQKYSKEWQESRIGLELSSKQKENAAPVSPRVNKAPAVGPTGLAGVLNVIADWSSGHTRVKAAATGANSYPVIRKVSGTDGNMSTKLISGGPPGYQGSGIADCGYTGPSGVTSSSTYNTPQKPSIDFKVSSTKPTQNNCASGQSTPADKNSRVLKNSLPPKPTGFNTSSLNSTPLNVPRKVSAANHNLSDRIGTTPPTGPAGWNSGPSLSYRGPRRQSPPPPRDAPPPSASNSCDTYRPKYENSGGSRRDEYHDVVRSGYGPGPGNDSRSGFRGAPGTEPRSDPRESPRFDSRHAARSVRHSPQFEDYRARPGDQYFDSRGRY
ncbi:hypothetical protein WAI453_000974 [Rhynchosporium graminicola]